MNLSETKRATLNCVVVRDIIRLYLEEHPTVSQADIARGLGIEPTALSRFLRMSRVSPKLDWEPYIKKLSEDIDYWAYVERTTKVRELLNEQQQKSVNAEFIAALCRKYSVEEIIPESMRKRNPSHPYYLAHAEGGADISIVNPADVNESWNFIYCRGKVNIGNGDFLRFTMFSPECSKSHLILVTKSEETFEDATELMRIGKAYGDGVMSGSVLLLRDGTIAREYTHGDLALYRLSSTACVEGGKATRSIAPPAK